MVRNCWQGAWHGAHSSVPTQEKQAQGLVLHSPSVALTPTPVCTITKKRRGAHVDAFTRSSEKGMMTLKKPVLPLVITWFH